MDRQRVSSDTEWEPKVGYSRAIRAGSHVSVSGTTATDENGEIVGEDDPHEQTIQSLHNVESALSEIGAEMTDVVRTRLYVTNIENWERIGEDHGSVFGEIRPATSMVEVSQLISPEILVEIEADAIIGNPE